MLYCEGIYTCEMSRRPEYEYAASLVITQKRAECFERKVPMNLTSPESLSAKEIA